MAFFSTLLVPVLELVLVLVLSLFIILMAAFLTLYERQVLASIQRRQGPNMVGPLGLLQAFADALKLLFKEQSIPVKSNRLFFLGSAIFVVWVSLIIWAVLPFSYGSVIADFNAGFLYFLSITSLGVYGIIVSGWSSNSRYSFLGSLRACAQLLSYELAATIILLIFFFHTGSLNLTEMVLCLNEPALGACFTTLYLFPLFCVWLVITLAETYRAPFDLAEAESELVSGFNVEYSSMNFAFLFLGEYIHIIIMTNMAVLLFFGAWFPPLSLVGLWFVPGFIWYGLKFWLVLFCFIWVRATFPRFRYDQLMAFGWKILLPFLFAVYVFLVVLTLLF